MKGRDAFGRFTTDYVHPRKGKLATKHCERCGVLFTPSKGQAKKIRFCTLSCAKKGNKARLGQRSSKTHVARIVAAKVGKPRFDMHGALNWRWRGGVTEENHRLRTSLAYKLWRRVVFERDDYTCKECRTRGGRLNADHIKPWALYPELRFEVDNGRTLCVDCHRKTDTWGAMSVYRT